MDEEKTTENLRKGVIISLLGLVIFTIGVYWYSQLIKTTTVSEEPVSTSTKLATVASPATTSSITEVGTETYRNDEFGFEFTYPAEYVVEETKMHEYSEDHVPDSRLAAYRYEGPVRNVTWIEILRSDNKKSGLEIEVYHSGGLSLLDWVDYVNKGVEEEYMYQGRDFHSVSITTIAGQEGVVAGSGCCMTCVKNYLFLRDGYVYKLSQSGYFSFDPELSGQCIRDADVFEKFVKSFKFWRDTVERKVTSESNSKYAQPIRQCVYDTPEDVKSDDASPDDVPKVWLGVSYYTSGVDISSGVLIEEVFEDSPAEQVGLKAGDVIHAVNNEQMINGDVFSVMVSRHCPGDVLAIDVSRDGKQHIFFATLGQN